MNKAFLILAALAALSSAPLLPQSAAPRWVATFEASPATYPDVNIPGAPAAHAPAAGTVRYRFGISAGGSQVIVKLTNELGDKTLHVGGASVALAAKDRDAQPGTMQRVTFGGKNSVDIAAGAFVLSDPLPMRVAALSELIGSVFVTEPVAFLPAGGAMLLADGDKVMAESFADAVPVKMRPILSAVYVLPEKPADTVVALGDSITDGLRMAPDAPHGWVANLARRTAARPDGGGVSVVTAGIAGNQVLHDLMGPAALARFDRDVAAVPGVKTVLLLEGINDIGLSGKTPFANTQPVTADELIAGYKQIALRAHLRGLRVVAGTLTPMDGAFYFSADKENVRAAVNAWLRTSKDFDGVIDFDAVMRDPAHPSQFKKDYDSGDHLHPSAAGYQAMADAIDLSLLR